MFGPNTYFEDTISINYSHRDKVFFDLFNDTRTLFSKKFNLNEYDILFIPGSGTVGIESIFYSIKNRISLIGNEGTFKKRWTEMEKGYSNKPIKKRIEMYCLLETSCSKNFYKEGCIVDAISGFPYFDIPKNTIAFVTCTNKLLGSYVGLSIVGIRKNCWNMFIDEKRMSYLNLSRYKSYHDINQAPSTSPTYIYEHLYKCLEKFDLIEFRNRINYVSGLIVETFGKENVIGNLCGPVITLKGGVIPDSFARKYDVYGYWSGRPNYQMFTYSQKVEDYVKFLNEYKKIGGSI